MCCEIQHICDRIDNLLHTCIIVILADFGIKQITNYDSDLMDSTILACVLASYCPFLIEMYFEDLYEHPCHPEQCTHNAIIFIRALKHIGIDYDILPSDICSPNAISMILFILHLYERMFSFKPKETLIFEAVLGEAVNQQVSQFIGISPLYYMYAFVQMHTITTVCRCN